MKYNISLFRSAKVLLNLEEFILELSPLNAKNRPAFLIGSLRKQISAIENKNITPAEPVEPASISPEKIQSMTDEQYQEYKEKQRTNYSQVEKGSGSKLREMFGNIGKID